MIINANENVEVNAPSNFTSELNFLNKPCGMRSTFTCIANIMSENAIAVAPIMAPPSERNSALIESSRPDWEKYGSK
ncbi:hypothetical protein GCM10009193_10480 [Shewanella aestuarii]|nr:hypothetical protein GCM10009193_10480 [Shewanella aestuarii]